MQSGGFHPSTAPEFRFRLVDFSRGIAALAVAGVHWKRFMIELPWASYSPGGLIPPLLPYLAPFYEYAPFAVQFFWLISGFVFAHVYGKTSIGFGSFVGRRVARLVPLHLLTLFVVALLQIGFVLLIGGTVFYIADVYHFFLNLFFIPSFGLEDGLSMNGPVWSVAVEIPIYMLFWLFVVKLHLNTVIALGVAAAFFLLQSAFPFTQVDYCGMLFFVGSAIYYISNRIAPAPLLILSLLAWFLGIAAIFLVPAVGSVLTLATVIAFGPPLAALGAADRLILDRPGIWDKMASFGDLSYSIYMLHVPLLMILAMTMIVLGIERAVFSNQLLPMLIFLLVTIAASYLSLHAFENPARRWLRKTLA